MNQPDSETSHLQTAVITESGPHYENRSLVTSYENSFSNVGPEVYNKHSS